MMEATNIDQAIIEELTVLGVCPVEEMVNRLAGCTWNQVFAAIDRMSRDGRLALQRPARFGYEVSIVSGRNHARQAEVTQ